MRTALAVDSKSPVRLNQVFAQKMLMTIPQHNCAGTKATKTGGLQVRSNSCDPQPHCFTATEQIQQSDDDCEMCSKGGRDQSQASEAVGAVS